MSPTKKKEPEGENIDGYLREFKKIKKKDRSPEKQWLAGGDSDQDLASIFQEFQQRTSVQGGFVQDSKAGSLLGEVTESKLNQMEPHDPLQSDGEEPEEKSNQPEGQLYDRAEAYVVESIQRAGSNQSPQLDEGADLVGRMIDSLKKHFLEIYFLT